MDIQVTGRPKKLSKKLATEAVEFYASVLMSTRMRRTLDLHINFITNTDIDCKATTLGTIDEYATPRMFDIDILNNMSKRMTLTILGHEMVHVKQIATGEMREYDRSPGIVRYRGQIYKDHAEEFYKWSDDYFEYLETPWEIEAAGREYALYARFIHHLRMKKKGLT